MLTPSPHRKPRRAFTLVELIVVIVILAILMAIAVPAYLAGRSAGHDSSALSDLNVAHRNVAAFITHDGRYGDTAHAVASRLGGSEPNLRVVATPEPPAAGTVQVALHDQGQTAHLCTMSASGVTFCLAMNAAGQLDDGQPTVARVATFRSWGHTAAAASCWLPTAETAPAENCPVAEQRGGGAGWKPTAVAADDGDDGGALGALPPNADFEEHSDAGFAAWADDSVGGGTVHLGEGHTGTNSAYLRAHTGISSVPSAGALISEPFAVDTSRDLILYQTGRANELAYLTVEFINGAGDVVATPVERHQASERYVYQTPPWHKWEPVTISTGLLPPGEYRLRVSATSPANGMGYGVWVDTLHYEGDELGD